MADEWLRSKEGKVAFMEAYKRQVQGQLSGQIQRILTPHKPDITSLLEKPKASEYLTHLSPDVIRKVA